MFRYKDFCYSNPENVYESMAADCPVMTSDGLSVSCDVTSTGYTITKSDGVTSSTISVTPVIQDCNIDWGSIADLNGIFYLWFIVAMGVMYMRRAAR